MIDDAPDDDPGRYLLRPAMPDDLPAFERIAAERAIGISSLPADRDALADRLRRSAHAFATDDDASGEEIYWFVLEDRRRGGHIIGTSGIAAAAGFHDRFHCYRNEFIVQASPALGARHRVHTLHLSHDLTGVTLLTGFHIEAGYAGTIAPQLLSRARLLFIAGNPGRFASDRIASENPGLADPNGRCPFWDAIGRRFFGMDFASAERLTHGPAKSLITDLMPQTPIYVNLLPEESQWAIGQLHPVAELPFEILLDEGFEAETWLNVFDGGPTVEARLAMLRTVRRLRTWRAGDGAASGRNDGSASGSGSARGRDALPASPEPGLRLVATRRREGFRALLAPADAQGRPQLDDAAWRGLQAPGTPVPTQLDIAALGTDVDTEAA
jgi:arginine N-succinyltransferase